MKKLLVILCAISLVGLSVTVADPLTRHHAPLGFWIDRACNMIAKSVCRKKKTEKQHGVLIKKIHKRPALL